jgi:hypothetical protein
MNCHALLLEGCSDIWEKLPSSRDYLQNMFFEWQREDVLHDYTHDYCSCTGRPAGLAIDSNGLPTLPEMLDPQVTVIDKDLLVEQRIMAFNFSQLPGGRDPLMEDVYKIALNVVRRYSYPIDGKELTHLRWLSSSWWCTDPRVVAIFPRKMRDPREDCGSLFRPS